MLQTQLFNIWQVTTDLAMDVWNKPEPFPEDFVITR